MEPTPTTNPISTNTHTKISTKSSSISKTPETIATTTPADCSEGWTQLSIGAYARVAGSESDSPNRVRSEPVKGDNTIAQIYPGETVKVLEGPVCADGLIFWKVENANIPDGSGWTAEGDKTDYWMEPLQTPFPTLTNSPTVQITSTTKPSTPIPTIADKDCAKGWTKLSAGMYAKVSGSENDSPNRVRSEPIMGDNTIAEIDPGGIVKVVSGPVCADGLVFWKVENSTIPNGSGWTAEGDKSDYWLEPYGYVPGSIQLSNYGVTISVPGSWSSVPDAEIVGSGSDPWCTWPEHIKITLTNYPAQSLWKPVIYVYETSDQPDWYPICPGAPLLRVRQKATAQGSRVLIGSKNAQPIFNSELIYAYEGHSLDGKHTIFAFMPVNYPLLAYSFQKLTLPAGGIPFNLDNQNWPDYYLKVGQQLEAVNDSDFTPILGLLDTIMESITMTQP
jgi:hypothetical protein